MAKKASVIRKKRPDGITEIKSDDAQAKMPLDLSALQALRALNAKKQQQPGTALQLEDLKTRASEYSPKVQAYKNRWQSLTDEINKFDSLKPFVVSTDYNKSEFIHLGIERLSSGWYIVGGIEALKCDNTKTLPHVSDISIAELMACTKLIVPLIEKIREQIRNQHQVIDTAIEEFDQIMAELDIHLSDPQADGEGE